MNKSYMPEIAQMLGVDDGEDFDVIRKDESYEGYSPYRFEHGEFIDCVGEGITSSTLLCLLEGKYTIKKRPWKPKEGDVYYYIRSTDGFLSTSTFISVDFTNLALLNMGNCFPTKDAAEAAVPEMLAKFQEIKKEILG